MVKNSEEIRTLAKKGRNAYMKVWRKKNPLKVEESLLKYWAKKGIELEKIDSK